jgi:hypothetical protein
MNINKMVELEILNKNYNIYIYSINDLSNHLSQNEIRKFLGYDEIIIETNEDIDEKADIEVSTDDNNLFNKIKKILFNKNNNNK